FLLPPPPLRPTLFPYTTLFRSSVRKTIGGAAPEFAPSFVERPELGEIPVRLLEVPTDDLRVLGRAIPGSPLEPIGEAHMHVRPGDRKSTRLNSSHEWISYAVFC